ncbi:CRISPR-associated ring nuclease Csm6 [Gallibacterium melopsittaci]|uniref:CRISPR-associated ring nuclease Csm6 n=1 Tax=Gallibacterium melopsittaci TaxID=516063 RepID=A0ABV6HV73_9PAST
MQNINKNILLSVTGMSPAVVTETLYVLVVEKGIIPTDIRVITTLQGKNKLMKVLLGEEGGRKESQGALAEFIADYGEQYGFSHIHFDESCIDIIKDKEGNPLPDIRTPEENQLASDQIVGLMATLCAEPDNAIHVSIAGGRKTMGFFLGYALSLYGRKQDTLSHVLVSEEFENLDGFYYPKPYPYKIYNKKGIELDAQNGKVMLAEIPWVQLSMGIPLALKDNKLSYSQSIERIQELLAPPSITFLNNDAECAVKFGKRTVILTAREYAFLLSICLFKLSNKPYIYLDLESREESNPIIPVFDTIRNSFDTEPHQTNLIDLKGLLSDCRTGIRKKLEMAFGVDGKNEFLNHYLPKSINVKQNQSFYELSLANEAIDISQIEHYLKKKSLVI